MKRFSPTLLIGLLYFGCATDIDEFDDSQFAADSQAAAKLAALFRDKEHQFGLVPQGTNPDFSFVIDNPYKDINLRILSAKASCGCTKTTFTETEIKPGQSGQVLATIQSSVGAGKKTATLTVRVEATRGKQRLEEEVQLRVGATITSSRGIYIEPSQDGFSFGQIPEGQIGKATIRVFSAARVVDIVSESDRLTATMKVSKTGSGYETEIEFSLAPGDAFSERVTLVFDNRVRKPLLATATTVSQIRFNTSIVMVKNGTSQQRVILKSDRALQVSLRDPVYRLTAKPFGNGNDQIIELSWDATATADALSKKLVFETVPPLLQPLQLDMRAAR